MVDAFHDVLFPTNIIYGSRGGPQRRTDIVTLKSGHEFRNAIWSRSRWRYDAGFGLKSLTDIQSVVAFFEAREGRLYAFRWRDPIENSSAQIGQEVSPDDQLLGVGDGTARTFQLKRTLSSGTESTEKDILLPVMSTVRVAVGGVEVPLQEYTVLSDGIIEFATPPSHGMEVTAGFLFDMPVRFDTDELSIILEPGGAKIPSIPLIEVFS